MTFFNFQNNNNNSSPPSPTNTSSTSSTSSNSPIVSPLFWIYWAVFVPLTASIVGVWWIWERRREKKYEEEDNELEKGVETMEIQIQTAMRKRTMSKVATWDTRQGVNE
jgi:sensor domain CHASE-containing protein